MAMIKCPECGQEISDKAKKCVHCGKVLIEDKPATKVCSDCGKENPMDVHLKKKVLWRYQYQYKQQ